VNVYLHALLISAFILIIIYKVYICQRFHSHYYQCEAITLYTDSYKWMSIQSCLNQLLEAIPHGDRVGPLVVVGLVNDSSVSANWESPPAINCQVFLFFYFFYFFNLLSFNGWTFIGNCNFRNTEVVI
jgi:hypothetical protein